MEQLPDDNAKARTREIAEQTIDACVTSALTVRAFSRVGGEPIDAQAAYEAMRAQIDEVRGGMLAGAETTLVGQATALNAIFSDLARRGQAHLDRPGNAAERYLRMALKAQNQCRATLDTLAGIACRPTKYWEERDAQRRIEPNVVVTQTNIAHGPMQVNNSFADGAAGGENAKNIRFELLETDEDAGEWLDGGATGEACGGDPAMDAMAAFDRGADG